jgi:putative PIN family toxin of toxin-antitoxin system
LITAVLDTNVLASGFVRTHTTPGQILQRWRRELFALVCSPVIFEELVRTLQSPYFTQRLSAEEILMNLQLLSRARFVPLTDSEVDGIATHPEDDLILATAVAGHADYLVTGDRQLLAIGEFQGVRIVNPAAFLALLDAADAQR